MTQITQDQALQEEVRKEVEDLFGDPGVSDIWLNTENPQFGGKKPKDLIATGKADLVRELIQSVKYGAMT